MKLQLSFYGLSFTLICLALFLGVNLHLNNSNQVHLISKFAMSGKRTMVIGHRGGFFGPENSISGFQGAIDNKIDGIEFDVSAFLVL